MKRTPTLLAAIVLLFSLSCATNAPKARHGEAPRLRSGPMLGSADLTEASVWVQTTAPAEVRVRYWLPGRESAARTSAPAVATEASHRTALVVLTRLEPGTRYEYEVLVNGAAVPRPYETTFTTQPFWQWRSDPPDFTVAVGSCYFANEAKSDRPGRPYGRSPAIFEKIAEKKPDVMLWLGDNVYYREPDFGSVASMKERNALAREEPALQRLLASSRHYAIWDDHDFGPNNAIWTYPLAGEALEIFKLFWANPTYGHRGTPGVFGMFQWGDVHFFLLDDRLYRTPEEAANAPARRMFGQEQLRWLKDALFYSHAPFKIIANGSQMLNANTVFDTFFHYPTEYRELLDWILANRISGVLFLSGDRHHTELLRLDPAGLYPLYDFTSSPLTSGASVVKEEANNPQRVSGTLVNDDQNFGLLRFSGPCNERVLALETYDSKGALRWTHEVRAKDLVPPPPPGSAPVEYRGHPACASLKRVR